MLNPLLIPQVQGATLVGVNGMSVEHLTFNDVTKMLCRAGRPIRMRFREHLEHPNFLQQQSPPSSPPEVTEGPEEAEEGEQGQLEKE